MFVQGNWRSSHSPISGCSHTANWSTWQYFKHAIWFEADICGRNVMVIWFGGFCDFNHHVSLQALTPYSMVPDWTPVAKNLTRVAWRPSTIAYNPVNLRFGWNVKDWSTWCSGGWRTWSRSGCCLLLSGRAPSTLKKREESLLKDFLISPPTELNVPCLKLRIVDHQCNDHHEN